MQNRVPLYVLALIVSVAASLTYNYVTQIERPSVDGRLRLHSQIINRQAPSPYNYRVLVPWITEAIAETASSGNEKAYTRVWQLAYAGYDFLSLTLFLTTLFILLRNWYSTPLSAVGVFFCAGLLPLSLRDHYFQPWSLIEAWFFSLAFLFAYQKKFSLLLALTAVAAFNRVTAAFIPPIYFLGAVSFGWVRERRYRELLEVALKSAALLSVAVVVIVFVRTLQGHHDHLHTLAYLWQRNMSPQALIKSTIHLSLFLGAGWFFALRGWKHADDFLRNQLLIVPLYAIPVIIFGIWYEVRLLLPLYPLLIALMLGPIQRELAQQKGAADNQ